jgi:anaerobic magnesium-protoporphyrin IX monomethyl ester cyclase
MDYVGGKIRSIAQDATRNCPPYGLYLLAALLRRDGHDVTVLDLIAAGTRSVLPFQQLLSTADLVGVTATSLSWPTALDVVRRVRSLNEHVPIVLGGVHPTMFDVYLLNRFPIQYVVRGEGERALPALCTAIAKHRTPETVPNLSWKTKRGNVVRNRVGPLMSAAEIAASPLPAFDLLPARIYQGLSIESSRGCAFDCSFCSTSYRQTWRAIAPDAFVRRLERLLPFLPKTVCHTVHIVDDEFSTDSKRATAIAQLLTKKGIRVQFVYDVRAKDLLDEDFTRAIAPYTNQFLVGAECGYDEGLEKIGKKTTVAQLENAARVLHEAGIAERANFSFILGLPWEGKQEIERTIDFASRLYQEYGVKILLQPYCLIPGSRLWQQERDKLVVTEAMYDDYGFFRNLHLWHSSQRVTPAEAWEVQDLLDAVRWLAHVVHPGRKMVQHSMPWLLSKYYPRSMFTTQGRRVGLESLRQVARPEGPTPKTHPSDAGRRV